MTGDNWQPSASLMTLRKRATLLKGIRQYFDEQAVLEVETPMLSGAATVDVFIDSFQVQYQPLGEGLPRKCYLHTSPEFAMKRLLAAGSGNIYSLGRVFRNGEAGGRHNPEFTMLEYYRVGMDQQGLMDDMTALLGSVSSFVEVSRISYGKVFQQYLDINPHTATLSDLNRLVHQYVDAHLDKLDRNDCLDLLFSSVIEPDLGKESSETLAGVYVYDYPASMSALARVHTNKEGYKVAARFELFVNGVELANGYHELTDATEQKERFIKEQEKRLAQNYPVYPFDQNLVTALEHGLPDCAGVAIGIDRLLMLMLGKKAIADVISFDFHRA
ncbi:poxB regulator PoxA [Endozoicomonas montiporae]|uniref:PoxB regulator PoxA n=2 Tax=Endozoicomonas montiporae TaxID=1027273 RepID=A0A081N1I9_9GAMM|nr:EF-P lysine aminoacylase EpmA [Endozoicomonas montiporae]AMO58759.1 lysyl-tRNA synthetase, class II [Endozoicomonas montiporae CL-33]KEQ12312.1 poxB regulator PoxA [Endozoicomonas montiporae]